MENALKWHKRALPLTIAIALMGAIGVYLDFSLQFSGNNGAAYTGSYEGLKSQLFTLMFISGVLILLQLILLAFGSNMGKGFQPLLGYVVATCAMLAVQLFLHYMALHNIVNEFTDSHTRRMYMGYIMCISAPAILPKIKEAIITGGGAYGQSLTRRLK